MPRQYRSGHTLPPPAKPTETKPIKPTSLPMGGFVWIPNAMPELNEAGLPYKQTTMYRMCREGELAPYEGMLWKKQGKYVYLNVKGIIAYYGLREVS